MAKLLVIRFSALGDVAMTVPVIASFARRYPEHEVTVISRAALGSVFNLLPSNVHYLQVDFRKDYKGISGLNKLFNRLRAMHFDRVIDLHNVLRSQYLCLRFKLSGVPTKAINKGKAEKRKLTRRKHKVRDALKSSFQRYADVFEQSGFPISLHFTALPVKHEAEDKVKRIGIAPFAKHKGKIYPLELSEQIVAHFANDPQVKVYLFGGGKEEQALLENWALKYPSVTSVAGTLTMDKELELMAGLNVMLSMDSANMHLASLVGVPVVSVWGATHPYAGFMGWGQSLSNCVQVDLECRPCSVFGNKECFRKDYACLCQITPEEIIEKIQPYITTC